MQKKTAISRVKIALLVEMYRQLRNKFGLILKSGWRRSFKISQNMVSLRYAQISSKAK